VFPTSWSFTAACPDACFNVPKSSMCSPVQPHGHTLLHANVKKGKRASLFLSVSHGVYRVRRRISEHARAGRNKKSSQRET
jgi:hypothetical protein